MPPSPPNGIRFGPFEVEPRAGELRKHGIRVKLQDQPFKVLLALIEKPGELVTRDELRERIWGNDTFVDFDHSLSAAVNRLREALSDSADRPRYVETMARRGYRFIAPVEGEPLPVTPTPKRLTLSRKAVWAVFASLVAAGAGVGWWLATDRRAPAPPRMVKLTALEGYETMPTFSPDGQQLAFVWNGENQDNLDIYVKQVGTATALRLTSERTADTLPAWSPDGRHIAFVGVRASVGLYLVSPLGGPEHKVIDLAVNARPSWSPDGRFLAVSKTYREPPARGDGTIFLVPVEGDATPREMLIPQPGAWYRHPAFSPDGRLLAVALCKGIVSDPKCQIQVVALGDGLQPRGAPRPIVPDWSYIFGLAWAPDGTVVVSRPAPLDPRLFSFRINGVAKPELIDLTVHRAVWPAITRNGRRLAFSESREHSDIWRTDRHGPPRPFLRSSARDSCPQFSPDGRRIAFESARSGDLIDVWLASAGATGLTQITSGPGSHNGSPRWSPDGEWITFDSLASNGRWDIWIIAASGGSPRQLTHGPGDNAISSWSRDGRRVYFMSNRSGRSEIWRTPWDGGTPEQVTTHGGYAGLVSADGTTLYYTKTESGAEGLFKLRLAGGDETQVFTDRVAVRSFVVFARGIYYICPTGGNAYEIRFHDLAARRKRTVASIQGPLHFALSVSPDEKTFLYAKVIADADLVLIENFR